MKFIIDDPHDSIQECWVKNTFYEQEELTAISKYIKPNSTILDVGANVGNHAMYFDKHVAPKIVYVIEPHPKAISIMLQNVAINYCHSICFDHIGIALGEIKSKCTVKEFQAHNLGGTKLEVSNQGFIDTLAGDDLNIQPDFIKIDVEGMEIQVLNGLKNTIKNYKPTMYVEVDNDNDVQFKQFIELYNYEIKEEYRNYPSCKNYLIVSR